MFRNQESTGFSFVTNFPLSCQEPAPMTEDVLEEQSEVLAKLGTSAEGAHLRARMQSACLLSDMESFKVRRKHLLSDNTTC